MSDPASPSPTRRLPASFWALNLSQFLGALNDNVFRWVMALALVARAGDSSVPLHISGIIFAVPFILFAPAAGILTDRFSKRRIILIVNTLEACFMGLGLLAFLSDNPFFIYSVLFLMVAQSTFFGPAKLGILPELVGRERLSHANGLMGMWVYFAIILGTVGGGELYALLQPETAPGAQPSTAPFWRASVLCIVLGLAGLAASFFIRETDVRAAGRRPSLFFLKDVVRNIRSCRANPYLRLTLFAIGFFLFLGAFVQINVTPYGMNVMGWDKNVALRLFLVLALGIGLGSYLVGRFSPRGVEIGFVPLGVLMVSVCLLAFGLRPTEPWLVVTLLFLAGLGGGFYIIPLNAFLQQSAPEHQRGELIATASFLSFVGVGLASGILLGLEQIPWIDEAGNFFLLGLVTLVLAAVTVWLLPDFLLRFVALIGTRCLYRIRVRGAENVPLEGGALLVANHVAYSDALILIATQQRRIRFLMAHDYYEQPRLRWLFKLMGCIPVRGTGGPKEIARSIQSAREAIAQGYLVCLFPEGALTRTGYTMPFKKGMEKILRGVEAPVVPVHLDGMWGSIFSWYYGRVPGRLPEVRRRDVTVRFGAHLPSTVSAFEARQVVTRLGAETMIEELPTLPTLPDEFTRVARRNWSKFCLADSSGKELNYGRALTGALAMAELLRPRVRDQQHIGFLLPISVGAVLGNLAINFLGRSSVNLNFTAPRRSIESAIEQCGIQTILTSRRFLEKYPYGDLPGIVCLEDLAEEITTPLKLRSMLRARLLPRKLLLRSVGPQDSTRPVTVLFSSGTTGEPKGVPLTHGNILSNLKSARQALSLRPEDVVLGFLPAFHSVGYTLTMWLPLISGIGAAYHFNPLEVEQVGRLAEKYKATLTISTPTFLLPIVRKVPKEQFATMRLVVTGAEKLKPRIAEAFEKKFGVPPTEGYGATECAPTVAVNMPDPKHQGDVPQVSNRPGSVGRPIPGVAVRIVHIDNPERELPPGEDGMVLVRGANVMPGYLGRPDRTREVLHDGWYRTGDIGHLDNDGFLTLTDRLSRFSKLGGEMVPHGAIEDEIQKICNKVEPVAGVTSVDDDRKGERLVVLLTPEAGDPDDIHRQLMQSDLPKLWIPSRKDLYTVQELPLLGTGKRDLKAMKTIATKHAAPDVAS